MLNNKVAIITGASSGIGKQVALTYAQNHCDLVLNYFSSAQEADALSVQKEVQSFGVKCEIVAGDISKYDEAENIVAFTVEKFGKIDILVNNAGITRDKLVLRMDENDFTDVININLNGTFNMCKHVYKIMMKQRSGAIINMSSVIGLMGNAGQVNYGASKAGVLGLTKSLAKELGARNVRVNAICPGFIQTPMTDVLTSEQVDGMLNAIALGRLGTTTDVANTALFLASDLASYITGQAITVDGGMVM